MPLSRLTSALKAVESAIEQAPPSMRNRLHADLLRTIALNDEPSRLLRALPLAWAPLHEDLSGAAMLGVALHAIGHHGMTPEAAARAAGVALREVLYVVALAERAKTPILSFNERVTDEVCAIVSSALESLAVTLEKPALEDMLIAAVESYAARRGRPEVYGTLWGTTATRPLSTPWTTSRDVVVSRATTQTRARATEHEVWPSSRSHAAHLLVAGCLFESLRIQGDYHSHPFDDWSSLVTNEGWQYSRADAEHAKVWCEEQRAAGGVGRFNIVVALARGESKGVLLRRMARNRVRVRLDDLHVVIAAYRTRSDGVLDEEVRLQVSL